MELDGWPVGSQVYLEKWVCPGLGRAIPDLLLTLLTLLRFRRALGGKSGDPLGESLVTGVSRVLAPHRLEALTQYHCSIFGSLLAKEAAVRCSGGVQLPNIKI